MNKREELSRFTAELTLGYLRSSQEFAMTSIKSAMIINGGAAIALLAYIGNFASDESATTEPRLIGWALLNFGVGSFVAAMALIVGYLAESSNFQHVFTRYLTTYMHDDTDSQDFIDNARKHARRLSFWSMLFCLLSLAMFYTGASLSYRAIFPT